MKLELAGPDVNDRVAAFAAVLDREEFCSELDRLCFSEWQCGTRQKVRARALKWHGDRCTFEIAMRTEGGWHSVIAKVYKMDRADIFQAMAALSRAGFGTEAEFSIPQPFIHLSSLGIRLEEMLQGPSAKEIFLNGSPDERFDAAERCAQWLGRFHRTAPPRGKVADLSGEFPRYRYWIDRVVSCGEPLASKAELLFEKLRAAIPDLSAIESCAGHGSYIPEHVIFSGWRTATIDLDEYDAADPGRDIAWFIVSLQRLALKHLGSLHALDGVAERFLRTYASSGRSDAMVNFSFYKALECLHGAKRDVINHSPPARDWAEIMLDEGLRACSPEQPRESCRCAGLSSLR